MPKVTQIKIGSVYLREVAPHRWRASWTDPLTRRHVRRLLPAGEFRDAERIVQEINRELAAGRGFGARLRGSAGHTVFDAVQEAVGHTDASAKTRRDYLYAFNPFAEYLSEHARGVAAWSDVTEEVLENYIEHCRRGKIAHDTLRQRLFVLRRTSAFMSRTYPGQYRHTAGAIRLKRQDPPKAELEEAQAILSPEQMRGLLAWLRDHEPMVHVWATLQGLCGLRLLEAAYLREGDFDPRASTVTICESSAHRPKNRPSYRTIPICAAGATALSSWIERLRVRHPEGYLFAPARPVARRMGAKSIEAGVGAYRADHLSHLWTAALREARREGLVLPAAFIPRKLRASFVTAMRSAGADFETLQRYIGHAAASMLAARYDRISLDRLKVIAGLAQALYTAAGAFQSGAKEAAN